MQPRNLTDMDQEKVEPLGIDNMARKNIPFKNIQRLCRDAKTRLDNYLEGGNVREKIDFVIKYLTSRPLLLTCIIAIISAITIPILIFTTFAIITVACTFTGFIIIEGTLLAFGALILSGVLFSIISWMIISGICLILSYWTCLHMYKLLKRLQK